MFIVNFRGLGFLDLFFILEINKTMANVKIISTSRIIFANNVDL